jgi:hypothetical protein
MDQRLLTWPQIRDPTPLRMISSSSRFTNKDSFLLPVRRCDLLESLSSLTRAIDRWANEIASDNGDSFKIQLPSDIKPGSYVLRTELIALHGNMKDLKQQALKGQIQIYLHCFNLDIVGSGTATPEGVTFPGAYKATDPSLTFKPYMTYGVPDPAEAMEWNSKYVSSREFCRYRMTNNNLSLHLVHPSMLASTTCPRARVQKLK